MKEKNIMKKRTFKAFIAVFAVVAILALTACSSYTSHYKAVAFVHTNTAKNAEMSFSSFKGTMVFKLKIAGGEEKITCSASLGEGSAKVYYDCGGAKKELFSVDSENDEDGTLRGLSGGTVYIIVEAADTCRQGKLKFTVENNTGFPETNISKTKPNAEEI